MSALPSLRQLRYLVALSEHGNFTRAAEACFVTQSTLSVGLKELESTLGVQLVERDRQTVRMTPVGEGAVARARELLAAAEDLVESTAAAAEPMSGTLRLGVIPTIAPFLLPSLVPEVRARYPKLRLALREDLTANLLVRLADGHLDFALIALPFDTEGLLVQPLFEDELWLVAPEDEPLLKAKRLTVSRQMAERLLILEEGHCLREHTLQACGRAQVASAEGLEATSLLTLVQMVASGMGLALVPEVAIKAGLLNATRLVARPLAPPAPTRTIALVARRSTARRRDFTALAECAVDLQRRRHGAVMTSIGRRAHDYPGREAPPRRRPPVGR
ncbi:MAG TPA: LysR substrate-binding domain-containing protein [Burkholderiaceae bacterium]|nr:LysR substrate-binding domain-containing protein [Burkholderiaceae bacterium]